MIGRLLLFVLAAACWAGDAALALEVSLSASRTEVAVGEQFTVAVEVKRGGVGNLPSPVLPDVPNLRRIGQYESRNFSYVNGRMVASLVVQHLFVADEPGSYTIGPATVGSGDERAQSATLEIRASAAGSSAPAPPGASRPSPGGAGAPPAPPATSASPGGRDLLVAADVDVETPYVNQQVTYTFTFLRRSGIQIFEGSQYVPPSATGLWAEELDSTEPTEVVLEGGRFVAERVRTAFFPTGPGEFTIGEAHLRTTVAERGARRRDPFDLFGGDPFGFFRPGREIRLATEPVTLRVRPLPEEGKPDDFCGAVGRFTLASSADKTDLRTGDPVTFKLTLAGEGNVKVVDAPNLSHLDGFKVYESQSSETSRPKNGRILGEKTWEYVLVPTIGGIGEIPSIHVSVFSPEKGAYETIATAPIPVSVQGATLDEALAAGEGADLAKERVRLRERDIRYVKPAPRALRRDGGPVAARPAFLAAHAASVLLFAGALLARRRRDRLASDVRWARGQKARGAAEKLLRSADAALGSGDVEGFYGGVSKALRGYVSDKLHLAAASLDETVVRDELVRRGASPEQVGFLFSMLQACDTARYAPGGMDRARAKDLGVQARRWIADAGRLGIWLLAAALAFDGTPPAAAAPSAALSTFERGNTLYEEGDFEGALQSFREVLASGFEDAAVHYNCGNAAFKSGRLGEAIFHYRRAHALAPRDEDVAANLEYARFLAVDATEEGARTDRRAESWLGKATPEEILRWAPALAGLAAVLGSASLFARRASRALRRAASAALALWVLAWAGAGFLAAWTARDPEAVVLARQSEVRSGPGPGFSTAFVLHEGAEVAVEGERGEWIEISLPGDLRGWIAAAHVARL